MTTVFSETSRLIIQNWDIVKELHRSETKLDTELRDLLFSMESRLVQCEWWDQQWFFKRNSENEVYIARREWKRGNDCAIWIGVEGFTAEALFGTDALASLYVWVSGSRPQLVSALRRCLEDAEDIRGEIQTKGNSAYVVTSTLRQCLHDELDRFDDVISIPMLNFFSCYAMRHNAFTTILNELENGDIQQLAQVELNHAGLS